MNLASATLSASCFRSGVLPPNPTIPSRTIEVLVWSTSTGRQHIALAELGTIQLGDAPAIRPPEAVEGAQSTLSWQTNVQRPIADQYVEVRQTSAQFTFADLAATSSTGTLAVSAQYACIVGRAACPTGSAAPQDSSSCALSIPFTVQEIPLTAKWTATQAPVGGAARYLVAIDTAPVTSISVPSCFRNNNLPAGRGNSTQQNGRMLDVCQVFTIGSSSFLRLSPQTWNLGDAPTIRINGDLDVSMGAFVQRISQQLPISDQYVETRSTEVLVPLFSGAEAESRLDLRSVYSCAAGLASCPVGDASPQDAASCQVSMNSVAVRLP